MTVEQCDLVWFKTCLNDHNLVTLFQRIALIITDIDGTLTDASIYMQDGMEDVKGYSVQDGYATHKAIKAGLHIAFLTGKTGKTIQKRAKALGVPNHLCRLGAPSNKIDHVRALQKSVSATKENTLLFGDDYLDIETKPAVGLLACPLNAPFYIQNASDLIVPKRGGYGAFRLILDLILYVQQKHFAQDLIEACL